MYKKNSSFKIRKKKIELFRRLLNCNSLIHILYENYHLVFEKLIEISFLRVLVEILEFYLSL